MLCVSDRRSVTLISVTSRISCHMRPVNAGNSIPPITLVDYTGFPLLYERIGCQGTALISYQNQQHGVIGSVGPSALVISSSTLHQLSSSMSSLCFTCLLRAHLNSRWRFTSWTRTLCVGTRSDWPAHLFSHCLKKNDWQVPSPNKSPGRRRWLLVDEWQHSRCRASCCTLHGMTSLVSQTAVHRTWCLWGKKLCLILQSV